MNSKNYSLKELDEHCKSLMSLISEYGKRFDEQVASSKQWFEELEKRAELIQKNVAKGVRMEKTIKCEIDKVEEGGIGMQVNETCALAKICPHRRQPAKTSDAKVTSKVFTYRLSKKHPERVVAFYQILVKLHAIDPDTDHEEFEKLFSGVPTDVIVKWLAPKSALHALMKELKDRELITEKGQIWSITESHFKDKDGKLFKNLRNQHSPARLAAVISLIADTLDPRKEVRSVNTLDDDTADELWSGIHDRGWEL